MVEKGAQKRGRLARSRCFSYSQFAVSFHLSLTFRSSALNNTFRELQNLLAFSAQSLLSHQIAPSVGMVSARTGILRKITQAPKPHLLVSRSRKRSESESGEDDDDYDDIFCEKCGSGENPDKLLLCDKCNRGFHLFCLRPILVSVPRGSWFCPSCSNDKTLTSTLIDLILHICIIIYSIPFRD